MLPGVRTLVSIPAGLVRIPFPKFFLATFAGAYIWCTILIGAGYLLGHEWHLISEYIKTHLPLVFGLGFLLVAAYLVYHYRASLPIPSWMRQTNKELELKHELAFANPLKACLEALQTQHGNGSFAKLKWMPA